MNVISCADLVVSVGIGIDYPAHIALAFLRGGGPDGPGGGALAAIGPAVLNGGASTFLAVAVTAFSRTEAFFILFKVGGFLVSC